MSVNEKMKAIADTIRRYVSTTQKLTLDDMPPYISEACMNNYVNGVNDGEISGFERGKTEGVEEGYNTATEEINTELLEIIEVQESYIYTMITFKFKENEYTLRESEAYWTDKLCFPPIWNPEGGQIWNDNGYAKWEYYLISDSQNNYVKYGDAIKNSEQYWSEESIEFFIQCDDGNKYTIKIPGYSATDLPSLPGIDNRFVEAHDDFYNFLGCYFISENGKKYFIPFEYNDINIFLGDIISATLVEGGNE